MFHANRRAAGVLAECVVMGINLSHGMLSQETARSVPDPFPSRRVGSGTETTVRSHCHGLYVASMG